MEFVSSHDKEIACHTVNKMIEACNMIMVWNEHTQSTDDYLLSMDGMQKLAATSMLIESIGEGAKKLDRLLPNFLTENAPTIPWQSVKGLRDHIAHGYFNIDADIVYDVAVNEIPGLKAVLESLVALLK
jgi:uncharacterized protein with HEPN domain